MGKNKSTKFFQGKEAFQRMNFLFQASEFLSARVKQPKLAAYYGSQMTSICKKSVLRMEPRVKRQLCKGCRAPLVHGLSSRVRLHSPKIIVITCLQCGTIKRFPMKQGYRVWVESPEACLETLTTGNILPTQPQKSEGNDNKHVEHHKSHGLSTISEEKIKLPNIKTVQSADNIAPNEREDICTPRMELDVKENE